MSDNRKKRKLGLFIAIYLFLLALVVVLFISVRWLAVIFFVFLAIFFFIGLVIASKGKSYEERVDSVLDNLVTFLVRINLGTYDTVVLMFKRFIVFVKDFYLNVVVPLVVFMGVMLFSYLLLILLRFINTAYPNGVTYFVIFLAFISPLGVNYLQYGIKSARLQKKEIDSYVGKIREKVRSIFLSSLEIGLAFLFFFMDSTTAFFIPENLRDVPLTSYLGKYDLTLRLYDRCQLDLAFILVMSSITINFLKVFLEKAIYHFYLRHGYISRESLAIKPFRYTNLILTTIALHIIFLPFIRLKHLVLTVGFAANLTADIIAALKEKEVWIAKEEKPLDIVGQLNQYVIVPILRKILSLFSLFTPF